MNSNKTVVSAFAFILVLSTFVILASSSKFTGNSGYSATESMQQLNPGGTAAHPYASKQATKPNEKYQNDDDDDSDSDEDSDSVYYDEDDYSSEEENNELPGAPEEGAGENGPANPSTPSTPDVPTTVASP